MLKVVRFSGGLANRMFQYCFYLYLKENKYEAYIDDTTPVDFPHEAIVWNTIFPNANYEKASKWKCIKNGGGFDVVSKFLRHYFPRLTRCKIMGAFGYPDCDTLNRFHYFIGVMFNQSYCCSVRDKIINTFKFAEFEENSVNEQRAKTMLSCNSVSIHIRMGQDYALRSYYQGCCTLEYYRRAIEYVKQNVVNPVFFVFTDNPAWVKENMIDSDYTLVDDNPTVGWGNHFDMQLMGCCKYNIIANSTYSWWGAFLNTYPDKIVIAPKYWVNPQNYSPNVYEGNVYPDSWLLF